MKVIIDVTQFSKDPNKPVKALAANLLVILVVSLVTVQVALGGPDNHGKPGANSRQAQTSEASAPAKTDTSFEQVTGTDNDQNSQTPQSENNLANLEALLNIIANGTEILGLHFGATLLVAGSFVAAIRKNKRWIGGVLGGCGVLSMVFGLAIPGIINWLVASARDANLFS